MIQRYPNDLDEAMIFWPAVYIGTEAVQFARVARAFAEPGAWPSLAKRQRLLAAELEACDGLDGVKDGVISNAKACQARFDPATAMVGGVPLRCPSGKDESDQCLSDVQIRALKVFNTSAKPAFRLPDGEAGSPATMPGVSFCPDGARGGRPVVGIVSPCQILAVGR